MNLFRAYGTLVACLGKVLPVATLNPSELGSYLRYSQAYDIKSTLFDIDRECLIGPGAYSNMMKLLYPVFKFDMVIMFSYMYMYSWKIKVTKYWTKPL